MSSTAPPGGISRDRLVQRLFDAALEVEAAGRPAFLASHCGEDLDLLREVELLVASAGNLRTQDVLPALLSDEAAAPTNMPTPSSTLTGLRVHNYQIDGQIGAGGMATVYLAHHLSFPRKAALKVLQEQASRNAEIVQRFLNEAKAANAIRHPHIIEVIDAGRLEGTGAPYILMEYLDGESLGARVRRGPLPVDDAVRFAIEIADALAAAHDKGIVHRDLKPENLFLVSREDGADSIKVLDFGISKLRADVASTVAHTQTGAFMGTPLYMSPEHCRSASGVDHRTDIYSLGVIMYEMVCGKPPFRSDSGFGELIHLHLTATPVPPRKLVPDLPPAVEAIILRCLAKLPEDRFASMPEVARALRATLPGGAVLPSPPGAPIPLPSIARTPTNLPSDGGRARPGRRTIVMAAVGLFLVAVAGGAGWVLVGRNRTAPISAAPAPDSAGAAAPPAVGRREDRTPVPDPPSAAAAAAPAGRTIAAPANGREPSALRHSWLADRERPEGATVRKKGGGFAVGDKPDAPRTNETVERPAAHEKPARHKQERSDIPRNLQTNPY